MKSEHSEFETRRTPNGLVFQLARIPVLHAGDLGSMPSRTTLKFRHVGLYIWRRVALTELFQYWNVSSVWSEQAAVNRQALGSNPRRSANVVFVGEVFQR